MVSVSVDVDPGAGPIKVVNSVSVEKMLIVAAPVATEVGRPVE